MASLGTTVALARRSGVSAGLRPSEAVDVAVNGLRPRDVHRLRRGDVHRLRREEVDGPLARIIVNAFGDRGGRPSGEVVNAFGECAARWKRSRQSGDAGSPFPPQAVSRRRRCTSPPQASTPSGAARSLARARAQAKPVHDLDPFKRRQSTDWLARLNLSLAVCSVRSRPQPAAPVTAARSASTAPPRTAGGWLWLASRRDRNHERSFRMAFQVEELSLQFGRGVGSPDAAHSPTRQSPGRSAATRGKQHRAQLRRSRLLGSRQSTRAAVHGGGERGGDAACAAPGCRLAPRNGRGRAGCDEADGADCGDTLEDDAGLALQFFTSCASCSAAPSASASYAARSTT